MEYGCVPNGFRLITSVTPWNNEQTDYVQARWPTHSIAVADRGIWIISQLSHSRSPSICFRNFLPSCLPPPPKKKLAKTLDFKLTFALLKK